LLHGRLRDRALEAVAAIASDLVVLEEGAIATEKYFPQSLGYGGAGIALFLHYWARATGEKQFQESVDNYLEGGISAVANSRMPCALFRGFSGVSWAIRHIWRQRRKAPDDDAWNELDAAIEVWVGRESTPTELLEGLGGILLYVAEHGVRATTCRIFERIRLGLAEVAHNKGKDCAWPVSDRIQKDYEWHLTLSSRERFQLSEDWLRQGMTGYYKLSVAHGCIGTAAALVSAIQAGFEHPTAEAMAVRAAQFVLSWEMPSGSPSTFPNVPGTLLPKWTGGWCDGDTGIAAMILRIGRALGRDDLQRHGQRIARIEAERRIDDVEEPNRRNN
jgi:hypothetical protein